MLCLGPQWSFSYQAAALANSSESCHLPATATFDRWQADVPVCRSLSCYSCFPSNSPPCPNLTPPHPPPPTSEDMGRKWANTPGLNKRWKRRLTVPRKGGGRGGGGEGGSLWVRNEGVGEREVSIKSVAVRNYQTFLRIKYTQWYSQDFHTQHIFSGK